MPNECVLVLTTVPDDERGEALARTLVDDRLAACVNLHRPMVSIYRWKGQVQRDTERQLVIKTTRDRLPALEARIHEVHTYDLPEFIVISIDGGSAAYVKWVLGQTGLAK